MYVGFIVGLDRTLMHRNKRDRKICILSSVPILLWIFYHDLFGPLRSVFDKVTVAAADMPELKGFEDKFGCSILPLNIARRITPIRDGLLILRFAVHLFCEKYEIVHAHTPKGGLIGMTAAFLARIPNRIYTVHGLPLETAVGIKRKVLRFSEWWSCKLATHVLVVSESLRLRMVAEKICHDSKMRILGKGTACGVKLPYFRPSEKTKSAGQRVREEWGIAADALVIGYIGRIVPDKGIGSLVEAFEIVHQQIAKSYLLMIGPFESVRQTLTAHLNERINSNEFIFCNNDFIHDIVPCYAAMDIVALPSHREGFPMVVLEAAALGLPTVATNVTGCVDAVIDNYTGLLVDVDDSRQLAEALLRLARSPQLRKELGQNGLERVHKDFDSAALVKEHVELYKKLLSAGH